MTVDERLDLIAAQLAHEALRCRALGDREGARMHAVLSRELDAVRLDLRRVQRTPLDGGRKVAA